MKLLERNSDLRALLDTNIIIHRETEKVVNQSIGTLFKWLDKAKYEKCVHPITIKELQKYKDKEKLLSLNIKLESYIELKTVAPLAKKVQLVSGEFDISQNDQNDSALLNEIFQDRVDILVSEDKNIHRKAFKLNIHDQVFTINGFLEKVVSENPELIEYRVLNVTKNYFGQININDSFFDSFRIDYKEFDRWFNKKSDEICYVSKNNEHLLSFLYLKIEDQSENYSDISPVFKPKRRIKIGTFKVLSNGVRLGERFLKIIFDNAIKSKVDEIYITIFNKTEDQKRLIELLYDWGFEDHGTKNTRSGEELVLVRDFAPNFLPDNPRKTYPYFSLDRKIWLCAIYQEYHTELFPDSILTTESEMKFKEDKPHRNALKKIFISRSYKRNLNSGDIIVFYRTGGYHKGVVTTIGIVESVIKDISNEAEFVLKCRKRSVFTDTKLKEFWNYRKMNRPFIINFLYTYSFPKRPNLAKLIELGVIENTQSVPRGFELISNEQFYDIIKESQSNESIIVN